MKQGIINDAYVAAMQDLAKAKDEFKQMMKPTDAQRYQHIRQNPAMFDQMIKRFGRERTLEWMKQHEVNNGTSQ